MQNFANQSLNLLELSPSNKVFYFPDKSYGILVGYRETEHNKLIISRYLFIIYQFWFLLVNCEESE